MSDEDLGPLHIGPGDLRRAATLLLAHIGGDHDGADHQLLESARLDRLPEAVLAMMHVGLTLIVPRMSEADAVEVLAAIARANAVAEAAERDDQGDDDDPPTPPDAA